MVRLLRVSFVPPCDIFGLTAPNETTENKATCCTDTRVRETVECENYFPTTIL